MLTGAHRDLLLERRRLLVGLAAVAVVVLYAVAVADGALTDISSRSDRLLRMAAATALATACLSASWRHDGRERAGLLVLTGGAQAWAVVQAVHLGRDLPGAPADPAGLDALATVVLCGSAAVALWLLQPPGGRGSALRIAAEWLLTAVSSLLLVRVAVPSFWAPGHELADWTVAAAVSVLATAALLTWARPWPTLHAWPLITGGLAALAPALVLASSSTNRMTPLSSVLLAASLALVALGIALGAQPGAPLAGRAGTPAAAAATAVVAWLLPLIALCVVLLDQLTTGQLEPSVQFGLLLLALLAVGRAHLLNLEARSQVRQLSETEQALRHRAFHDDLTGLANRALFHDRLAHALDLHRRHRLPLSVLYGDLDGFKRVNDLHGHAVGDALLAAVAHRLRQCVRPEDTLARLGGDEFVLLLEHGSSSQAVMDRLREVLLEPFTVDAGRFSVRMSLGVAEVGADAPTPSPHEVLERADAQMYVRKSVRQAQLPSAPAERPPATSEPALAAALARALHSGRVSVVYQPVVDAGTGVVHGLEALARWQHEGRVLLPEAFVELAEGFGLAGTLTDVVLEQSCAQLKAWSLAVGHRRLTMSVNMSPSQLGDPTLTARVRGAVERHGLDREQVVLETTVAAVSSAGPYDGADGGVLQLSLGDFTGGADDFALLRALPVRSVKVPGSRSAVGDRLLHVLVALGRELGVTVVVERVERPDELLVLRQLSGVLVQGYLVSRPAEATTLDHVVLHGCPLPA